MTSTTAFAPVTVHTGDDANPLTVDARVWAMYHLKRDGMGPKDIAAKFGITPGPVGSAFTRVRDAIDAGRTVIVGSDDNGVGLDGTVSTDDTAPTLDALAIADEMMPGASDIMRAIENHGKRAQDIVQAATDALAKAEQAVNDANAKADQAHAQADGLKDLLTRAGFDWTVFESRITPTDDEGDDKPES